MACEKNADETEINTSSSSSEGPVILPTDNDVLCGRGGGILAHPGNIYYRSLVDGKKREYLSRRFKREKRSIAVNIVKEIRSGNGRFLTKNNGEWQDIGDNKAHEKTLQALREDAPKVRRKIESEEAAELEKARQKMIRDQDDARRNAQAKAIADREMQERGYYWPSRPQPLPLPRLPCACTPKPPQSRKSPTCAGAFTFPGCACTCTTCSNTCSSPTGTYPPPPPPPRPVNQMPVLPSSFPLPHNVFVPASSPIHATEDNNKDIGGSATSQHLLPPHCYIAPHQQPPPPLIPPLPRPRPPPRQVDNKLGRKGNTVIKGQKYKLVGKSA